MEDHFDRYTQALCAEIERMGRYRHRPAVHTLFLGGGTPTVLRVPQLAAILSACRRAFDVQPDAEITIEANPGTVDETYLRALVEAGVNRFSFGAQSFSPAELRVLGRLHTAEAIGQTVAAARRAGIANLNLDLMYALPAQTLSTWRDTLRRAIALQPEHLSLYSLTLEPGTALRARVSRGELPSPDSDLAADMYELADVLLATAGYTQYEISNWCKPGFECRHNLTYWRNHPWLGMGAGAHSSEGGERWWNARPVPRYIELATAAETPHPHPARVGGETIDRRLEMGETMMLGLRLTREGVSLPEFEARFGVSVADAFGPAVEKLKALNLLAEENQRLRLTPPARLLGNQVFLHFLPE